MATRFTITVPGGVIPPHIARMMERVLLVKAKEYAPAATIQFGNPNLLQVHVRDGYVDVVRTSDPATIEERFFIEECMEADAVLFVIKRVRMAYEMPDQFVSARQIASNYSEEKRQYIEEMKE